VAVQHAGKVLVADPDLGKPGLLVVVSDLAAKFHHVGPEGFGEVEGRGEHRLQDPLFQYGCFVLRGWPHARDLGGRPATPWDAVRDSGRR